MRARNVSVAATLAFLIGGIVASRILNGAAGDRTWLAGAVCLGAPLVFRTVRNAFRDKPATDVAATLSIVGADSLGRAISMNARRARCPGVAGPSVR